jgi:3-isopropylmalate/(R)-2-methylmalate dehydratase small subunit
MRLRVRKVCGTISTDDILPARYKHTTTDPRELATHVFEYRFGPEHPRFEKGDCIVSDSIFGIGSSREQAASALCAAGVSAIIAPAFGRIFYRNCWNLALPAIEADLTDCLENDSIELALADGLMVTSKKTVLFARPPEWLLCVYRNGGLLNYLEMNSRNAVTQREEGAGASI